MDFPFMSFCKRNNPAFSLPNAVERYTSFSCHLISPLSELRELRIFDLKSNSIIDITVLASLTRLSELNLSDNQIRDIKLLVDNTRLTVGDGVILKNNPLSDEPVITSIPQLIERGVTVKRWSYRLLNFIYSYSCLSKDFLISEIDSRSAAIDRNDSKDEQWIVGARELKCLLLR